MASCVAARAASASDRALARHRMSHSWVVLQVNSAKIGEEEEEEEETQEQEEEKEVTAGE